MKFWLVVLTALFASGFAPAAAGDFIDVAYTQVGGDTSIPVGHYEFCKAHRSDCGPNRQVVAAVALTEANWAELVAVNNEMNTGIRPLSDEEQYGVAERWAYPTSGAGDCEDYVLAKRWALEQRGWPRSTLLIATVRQPSGEGHAVLLVRTDRGDVVLDNQDGKILLWNETPYTFLKRQAQEDSSRWVAILDDRVEVASRH